MTARPMRLGRRQPLGHAIVQLGVVERAFAHRGVILRNRRLQLDGIEASAARPVRPSVSALHRRIHRRHEQHHRLAVQDRVGDLPPAAARSDGPKWRSASARNPRPRHRSGRPLRFTTMLNGTLSSRVVMPPSNFGARASSATAWHCVGSPHGGHALVQQIAQHAAAIERRAADDEIVDCIAPVFAHPVPGSPGTPPDATTTQRALTVAGKAAIGDLGPAHRTVVHRQGQHLAVIDDFHAQPLGGQVVGVDQRLAAAQEEGVGAAQG